MNQQPLVSIIFPVYNAEKHLREAIDSLLSQTYSNLEIIIIDDASTDNSPEIIKSYTDTRVKSSRNEHNLRIVQTLNTAIEKANGEFIARMDSDDIAVPDRIEKQVAYLSAHPEVSVADTIMEYIDEQSKPLNRYNNNITDSKEILKTLPRSNPLGHSSIMARRAVYEQYKYRQIDYEDYDLWLRLINDNKQIHKIALPLLKYRIHAASITGTAVATNKHFYKLAVSKMFYYRRLSFTDMFKALNLVVLLTALKAYLIWFWKMLKQKK